MSNNINIKKFKILEKPIKLKEQLTASPDTIKFIENTRKKINDILQQKDKRLLCIIGPCSIHNIEEALEYGKKLKKLSEKVKDRMLIVMRVYFEKPRTTIGWKGLINDPHLDNSHHVNYGLYLARRLLLDLNRLKIPCGYEILDTITPQYIADLISWGAIGARTTESQVHRQLISGVSMPVGFKNGTQGNIKIAADAVLAARYSHCFMGINSQGNAAICTTKGNQACHIILRGGNNTPNYFPKNIAEAQQILHNNNLPEIVMIDCSHGNSGKDHTLQGGILLNIIQQANDNSGIIGFMLESNHLEGKQQLIKDTMPKYGISITDSCISFKETEIFIQKAYTMLTPRFKKIDLNL